MEGLVISDAVSWAERDEARQVLRSRATSIHERDALLVARFADADVALAAALDLRGAGLLCTSRVAVAEGPVDIVGDGFDGPGVRRALALLRLGRAGVLLVPASIADRVGALPVPNERWFLTLSELVGPEPVVALLPDEPALTSPPVPFPLPAPVRASAATPFIGRVDALDALRESWHQARAGTRTTVVLRANAGMGKTRLAAALAEVVHRDGGVVFASHFDAGVAPNRPFADVLRFYVDRRGASRLRAELGSSASDLSRLVPDLEPELGAPRDLPGDADLERHRLFESVDSWLASAAATDGLLLLLDDVHLATPDAIGLLAHIVRSTRPARLLVLLLCRADEASAGWDELVRVAGDDIEIRGLEGFDDAEIAEVAAAHLPVADRVARRLSGPIGAVTAGNPLYVVQLAHHLAENGLGGARAADGAALLDTVGLPGTVREVLERRLELLGEVGLDVLSRAAIVGDPFDLSLLGAIVDVDVDDATVADVVEEGRRRGLLHDVEPGWVGFTHGLVRAAFADRIGATRAARLHGRIADAILARIGSDLDARAAEVAGHLIAAGATDPRTFELARRGGAQALRELGAGEAVTLFAAANKALPPDADDALRDEVALDLAIAQHLSGRASAVDDIITVGRRAGERGDSDTLVRAALACTRGFFGRLADIDQARVELLEAAIAAHPPRDATRARLLARLATEISFGHRVAERQAFVDEALAIAREIESADVLVDALIAAQLTFNDTDRLDERLELTKELVDVADGLDDPVQRTRARWFRVNCLQEVGDLKGVEAIVEEAVRLADQIGQPTLQWASRIVRGSCIASRGALAAAEAEAFATYELGMRAGQPDAILFYGGDLYAIRYEQDRLRSLAQLFQPFADVEGAVPMVVAMQALIDCELGDDEAAQRRLSAIMAAGLEDIPRDELRGSTLATVAEVARRLVDRDALLVLDALFVADPAGLIINASGAIGLSGAVTYHLGRVRAALGDTASATALLEQALTRHEAIGAPVWIGRAQVALAELLVDADPDRARVLATAAATVAAELDLPALRREAQALL